LFGEYFTMAKWPQRLLLNNADRVVTVSEYSKKETIEKLRLTKREVCVVYNAPNSLPEKQSKNDKATKILYIWVHLCRTRTLKS